ncbi:MAG: FecR family protein [Kofleriaceae bacterium]
MEPLADVAWSRVERGVWARLDDEVAPAPARGRRPWWIALPIAAVAIAAVAFVVRAPAPADEAGPTRIVSEASPSTIALADAHITLDPHSAIVMRAGPDAIVERGAAWFAVEPRGSRPPFVVVAGDAHVRVVGTRFRVEHDGERVAVEVDHGTVEVGYHGEVVRLTAAQHWRSDAPTIIADAPADTPAETPPAPQIVPSPPPQIVPRPSARPAMSPADRDGQRFAELTRIEVSSPDAAMKGYLALSQGAGRWAEVALFAAARLAADRHDSRATTLLGIYLRRFPNGANVVDARQLEAHLKGAQP